MKTFTLLTVLLSTTAAIAAGPASVNVKLHGAMVPSGYNLKNQFVGYDNNDSEVLFTVLGTLGNTCQRVGPYSYKIEGNDIKIFQTALEYKGTGKVCIQTNVPFANDIRLPTIDTENLKHQIVDGTSGAILGKLPIAESPVAEPDSDLYLNVTDARLWFDPKAKVGEQWRAVVVGKINHDCTKLKTVHVDVLEKEHAIVVRPVLDRDESVADADCAPNERIQHSEPIPLDLKGIWLLHVRSVQGAGKHELVDTDSFRLP
jgi:hypothetical protein